VPPQSPTTSAGESPFAGSRPHHMFVACPAVSPCHRPRVPAPNCPGTLDPAHAFSGDAGGSSSAAPAAAVGPLHPASSGPGIGALHPVPGSAARTPGEAIDVIGETVHHRDSRVGLQRSSCRGTCIINLVVPCGRCRSWMPQWLRRVQGRSLPSCMWAGLRRMRDGTARKS